MPAFSFYIPAFALPIGQCERRFLLPFTASHKKHGDNWRQLIQIIEARGKRGEARRKTQDARGERQDARRKRQEARYNWRQLIQHPFVPFVPFVANHPFVILCLLWRITLL